MDKDELFEVAEQKRLLASKIQREIQRYRIRKLLAQDEISSLSLLIKSHPDSYEMRSEWQRKISAAKEEIDLCQSQIDAYVYCRDSEKLIPDRLL